VHHVVAKGLKARCGHQGDGFGIINQQNFHGVF
jgi:hypothetical protein